MKEEVTPAIEQALPSAEAVNQVFTEAEKRRRASALRKQRMLALAIAVNQRLEAKQAGALTKKAFNKKQRKAKLAKRSRARNRR